MRHIISLSVILCILTQNILQANEEKSTNNIQEMDSKRAVTYTQGDPFGDLMMILRPAQLNSDDPFVFLQSTIPLLDAQNIFGSTVSSVKICAVISYMVGIRPLLNMLEVYNQLAASFAGTIPFYRAYTSSQLTLSGGGTGKYGPGVMKTPITPSLKIFFTPYAPSGNTMLCEEFQGIYTYNELVILVGNLYTQLISTGSCPTQN